jgi:hypothetical protein
MGLVLGTLFCKGPTLGLYTTLNSEGDFLGFCFIGDQSFLLTHYSNAILRGASEPAHHPLEAHYDSVVDEHQLSSSLVSPQVTHAGRLDPIYR